VGEVVPEERDSLKQSQHFSSRPHSHSNEIPYLEHILLYPRDAGRVVDDGEESNSSVGASPHRTISSNVSFHSTIH